MLFFLNHLRLVVFDDSLERYLKSSFEDDLQLHPLTGLSEHEERVFRTCLV